MPHPTSMLPSDYACPRCTCKACYALHRKGFDWVMSLIGLRPARCLTCGKRFYARYSMASSEPDEVSTAPPSQPQTLQQGQSGKGERGRPFNISFRKISFRKKSRKTA